MTEHLENEIARVLALKASKPVRQLDTLQSVCDLLHSDSPFDWVPGLGYFPANWLHGEKAGVGIVYRN